MGKHKELILALVIILCFGYVFAGTISSFNSQDNPFNISVTTTQNQTYSIDILRYSYIESINITATTIGNFSLIAGLDDGNFSLAWDVTIDGNILYVSEFSDDKIVSINVTNKSNPVVLDTIYANGVTEAIVSGNYLYTSDRFGDIVQSILITNPKNMVATDNITIPDAKGLAINDTTLYVIAEGNNRSLISIDISDPANMAILDQAQDITALYGANDVVLDDAGEVAFTVGVDSLASWDVSNPSSISQISEDNWGSVLDNVAEIEFQNDLLYIANAGNLLIVNVTDTSNMFIVEILDASSAIYADGNILYSVSTLNDSITAYDIREYNNTQKLLYYNDSIILNGLRSLTKNGDYLYTNGLVSSTYDVMILKLNLIDYLGLDIGGNYTQTYISKSFIGNTKNLDINIENINEILSNDCQEGLIVGDDCRINFTFSTNNTGKATINVTNITIYTNLTINIYDRTTTNLITQNVQVTIIGFDNYSTSTGIINDPYFSTEAGAWNVIASSNGYVTDQTQFTLTDQNSTTVDLYLINSSDPNIGNLIIEVLDDFYNYIVGANVKLLEYVPAQDAFIEVSQCYSDTNGECIFNVELNTKYYIVTATYTRDGDVLTGQTTSAGQLIKIDNTILPVYLKIAEQFEVDDLYDLIITPSNTNLTGNTSYLTATFNDATNDVHQVCIGYFIQNGLNQVLQASNCVNASSGIVNYAGGYLLDRDYTWIAKIYVLGDKTTVYYSYTYLKTEETFKSEFGLYLSYIIFAIVLASLALALWTKNMKIFAFLTIGFAPLAVYLDPDIMGGVTMVFIIILGLCILYLSGKKEGYT